MKRTTLTVIALASVSALAYFVQSSRLEIDGKLASTSVIVRDGVAYAPLKDIAAALGKTLTKTSSGYEISGSGGANQINGVTGKVGDVLFNGVARFEVVKIIRTKSYTTQFSGRHEVVKPDSPDNDLIVLVCRIKNGTNETYTCGLPGGEDTALTDMDEHAYKPKTGIVDAPSRGVKVLPGAAIDFSVAFEVRPSEQLKDLVYQVTFYGSRAASAKKFRVSLQE